MIICAEEYNNSLEFEFGLTLIIIGLLIKIGTMPFHIWLPDAYQSASYSILFFLLIFPKIFLYFLLSTFVLIDSPKTEAILLISIVLTAIFGSIEAVNQTKIKRFLAYTTIFNTASFLSILLISGNFSIYILMYSLLLYAINNSLIILLLLAMHPLYYKEILSLRDFNTLKSHHLIIASYL